MSKELPSRPSLEHLKHQARNLQRDHQGGDAVAIARVEANLPGVRGRLSLARAQTVIAREYGVESWPRLKALVEAQLLRQQRAEASRTAGLPEGALDLALEAIRTLDRDALAELLRRHPGLIVVQEGGAGGKNLLHHACEVQPAAIGRTPQDVMAMVDLLLGAGIDVNAPFALEEDGALLPTWFALRGGSLEVVEHLLHRGGRPDGLFAAAYGQSDAIPLLHRYGADLEVVSHDETPLLHALKNRRLEATRVLLQLGADPNHADSKGATPLHYAVRQYHEAPVIDVLLAHGASPELRSRRGATPRDLAVRMGRADIAAQLGVVGVERVGGGGHPGDVQLRPFVSIEDGMLEEAAAFYQRLGFACVALDLDHGFAAVRLEDATCLIGEGGTRERLARARVIYRCPPEVAARVRSAIEQHGIAHQVVSEGIRLEDCCGLELIFRLEERQGPPSVVTDLRLEVSDLERSRMFYRNVGFEEVGTGSGTRDLTLQLGSARVTLSGEGGAAGGGPPAVDLWLTCEDFDGTYQRVKSRVPTPLPEVAFHGDILFSVKDPDDHQLTFNAPATDL